MKLKCLKIGLLLLILVTIRCMVLAQTPDGNAGINEATSKVKSYFDAGCNLMYAIGAILGLVGAVRVYQKWSHGHPDTGSTAAAWFGSCVFLVVVATILKSFFGL
ncbi:MAG: DUF4134 domain-containing protein [Sphingobacteriia bacterium]|nr:DUF4134 domain-containing protein [Sphingobacteriia bacterium]